MPKTASFSFLAYLLFSGATAHAQGASNYYCREEPLADPIVFESGQKTCTDSAGAKTVAIAPTCMISTRCFFLSQELKAIILNVPISQITSDTVIAPERIRAVLEVNETTQVQYANPNIEKYGEITSLMCDAIPNPSPGAYPPYLCQIPQKCMGDRFMGMKPVPAPLSFPDADTQTLQRDANKMDFYPAAPKATGTAPTSNSSGTP